MELIGHIDMKLTRKVLIEKSLRFSFYNNPYSVPDEIWEIALKEIKKINEIECGLKYIIEKILSPLIKGQNYEISHVRENVRYPFRNVTFDNDWTFVIYDEILFLNFLDCDILEKAIWVIWRDRYETNT